jgi:ribosomal protein L22
MADEKDKQPKSGEDKPKSRRRAAAKPKAGAAETKSKSGAAKTGARTRQTKKDAPEPGAQKPAAKSDASKEKGEAKGKAKAPARSRGAAKKESKQAPKPRRGREPATRPVVRAQAKYVRSSARKARLVMDHVRGKPVSDARALLRHSPRGIARDLERLLASAVANAENNHDLVGDDLYVKEIYADEGPTLRRFRPRAQGRATRIRKRTSHLTVALSTKE